jgi:hypothetical protein
VAAVATRDCCWCSWRIIKDDVDAAGAAKLTALAAVASAGVDRIATEVVVCSAGGGDALGLEAGEGDRRPCPNTSRSVNGLRPERPVATAVAAARAATCTAAAAEADAADAAACADVESTS